MSKIKQLFRAYYHAVTSSIAFYPSIITVVLGLLAVVLVEYEGQEIKKYLLENSAYIVLKDKDTARTFLSALIGGMISLTVFSFSMVMILLNQASSNYSPRLLPGLISNRRHQLVLGTYLGTIIYATVIILNIQPNDNSIYDLPALGFIVAIALLFICLGLFIYFINNISNSIKVGTILTNLYKKTKYDLKDHIRRTDESKYSYNQLNFDKWHPIDLNEVGYFKDSAIDELLSILDQKDLILKFEVAKGDFILKNRTVVKLSKKVDDETIDRIRSTFNFTKEETADENYFYGFKHITEIALKAMSPGINDPGTAINSLDYLSDLFATKLNADLPLLFGKKDQLRIITKPISFENLLQTYLTQLREYSKHDAIVTQRIYDLLSYLRDNCKASESQKKIISAEIKKLKMDVAKNIENIADRKNMELS